MIDIIEKCSILELCKIWKHAFDLNTFECISEEISNVDHKEIELEKEPIVKYVKSFEKKKASSGYKMLI